MRNPLLLLVCLSLLGCTPKPAPAPALSRSETLKPLAIDEAAAYPSQEPGTRPPVLTGFQPLSQKELAEGWVRLFDGVSTYGWEVAEGEGTLVVKEWEEKGVFMFDAVVGKTGRIVHWLPEIAFDESVMIWATTPEKNNEDAAKSNFICTLKSERKGNAEIDVPLLSGIRDLQVKPKSMQPLGEADWKPAAGDSKSAWTDGVLELTGGSGYVESVQEYGDFVLQLEYYTEPNMNSGVFFRCIPGESMNGYECQVFNNPPAEDYEKFLGTDTGGIFRRIVGRNVGPKDGTWNYLTIAVAGPRIATWVNGIQTVDWTDTRAENDNPRKGLRTKPGTIQLQGHDVGTQIKFRNIRISTH